ncbi:MAG: SdiA-regulated domain-containing protein [Candidatus Aminicenantes bacterium]|nr:MAG: SdiA-regulated domain-containing protein [Candidatus Aminicenantes bacterium]
MKKCLSFCLIFLVILVACSNDKNSPTIRFPYLWLDEPGYGGDIDQQDFPEPSGVCFHPTRKTLFVVSDEGEIAEIEKDGTPVFRMEIPGDLEGVTAHPESGLLYLVKEGDDVIVEFDPDKREVIRSFPLNRAYQDNPDYIEKRTDSFDNGIESIAFVGDAKHPEGGTFYIGNQWDPPCVMEVQVPLKSSIGQTAEAHILRVLPLRLDDPAALYYDPQTGLLNVVSDADNILVEITLAGKIVREYAFLGDEQEGIARDDEGYLYIAQDLGGIIKVKDLR